jgi:hypothetical protein
MLVHAYADRASVSSIQRVSSPRRIFIHNNPTASPAVCRGIDVSRRRPDATNGAPKARRREFVGKRLALTAGLLVASAQLPVPVNYLSLAALLLRNEILMEVVNRVRVGKILLTAGRAATEVKNGVSFKRRGKRLIAAGNSNRTAARG